MKWHMPERKGLDKTGVYSCNYYLFRFTSNSDKSVLTFQIAGDRPSNYGFIKQILITSDYVS